MRDLATALRAFAHEGMRPCLSFLATGDWSLRVAGRTFRADAIEEVLERAAVHAKALHDLDGGGR